MIFGTETTFNNQKNKNITKKQEALVKGELISRGTKLLDLNVQFSTKISMAYYETGQYGPFKEKINQQTLSLEKIWWQVHETKALEQLS